MSEQSHPEQSHSGYDEGVEGVGREYNADTSGHARAEQSNIVAFEDSAGEWLCPPCGRGEPAVEPLSADDLRRDPGQRCEWCGAVLGGSND